MTEGVGMTGEGQDALNIAIIKSASKSLILIIAKFIKFYEWKIFANRKNKQGKKQKRPRFL